MTIPNYLYRKFVCRWFFVGWEMFSIGFSIDLKSPNIEIHLPTGFFRLGYEKHYSQEMTFLETCMDRAQKDILDIQQRLQGIEKYLAVERVDKAMSKPVAEVFKSQSSQG